MRPIAQLISLLILRSLRTLGILVIQLEACCYALKMIPCPVSALPVTLIGTIKLSKFYCDVKETL